MIESFLQAAYPLLLIETQEPERAQRQILETGPGWSYYSWDCLQGIRETPSGASDNETNPVEAILRFSTFQRKSVLIAHNLHLFFDSPDVIQALQSAALKLKAIGSCIVIICPRITLNRELEKLIHVLSMPLPNPDQLYAMQEDLINGISLTDANGTAAAIEPSQHAATMARGLTEFEAETAFALSLVRKGKMDPQVITDVKSQMIRKSGLMQFWEPVNPDQVGGLQELKNYIANRSIAYQPGKEHLPKPRGLLLVGIPGTGKSLSCKAAAAMFGWPLIRLDVSALKSSLQGESEQRMRQATQVIEAFGECVVWMDEVEKAVAGVQSSGQLDAGTTAGMFGHFLTWMQETTAPVFIMATANDITQLPPEFLRAGRFDAIFFVDLPTVQERMEILHIQNARYRSTIPEDAAVMALDGFTGAEIEQLAKDTVFDGYETAISNIVPLSRSSREKVKALQEWARSRARTANTKEPKILGRRQIQPLAAVQ